MKKFKICTPVIGKTIKEFLENLEKVQKVSELVELRSDLIKDFNVNDLQLIRKKTIKKAIFTSRRKEIILKALDLGFDYIDIDFSLINKLNFVKPIKTKIIISYHDFQKTPEKKDLEEIIAQMNKYKPDIIKLATLVNNESDNPRLFQLMLNKKVGEKRIIIGMGKKGRITRILGPLLGSYLTYASTRFGETAPGQIDISELKKFYGR